MDLSKLSTDDLKALQAGDLSKVSTQGLQHLQANQRAAAQLEVDRKQFDPTNDMGVVDRTLSGIGSGLTSAIRAVGGDRAATALGLPTKAEADRLDQPLMATMAGKVGQVIGTAAPAMLAVPFTPGTLVGALMAGGVTGAALTEGDIGDRALAAGMGAAGGAAGHVLPGLLRAGKNAVAGLAEPLTEAGRGRIAGRVIDRFAADKGALNGLTNLPTMTGARSTLAEAARDPGIATLERVIASMDPEVAAQIAARGQANNAARMATLQRIAGDASQRSAAEGARSAVTAPLYKAADDAVVGLDAAFQGFMQRPAFKAAVHQAEQLAKNEGLADLFFRSPKGEPIAITGQGAHYIKKALDDAMDRGSKSYMGEAAARATGRTQQAFLGWLEQSVPEYAAARQAFADMSGPLNRMDVGQRLLTKTTASMRDLIGERRLQANAFAKALNDEDALVKGATGLSRSLADVMTPDEMAALGAVRGELETMANLGHAANGPGSQTARMLASQNLMQRIAGPLGLPQSFAESVLARTAMRPVQFGMQAAEPRILESVARGLLDPEEALRMVNAARAADLVIPPNLMQQIARRSTPAAIGGAAAYANRASE